MASIEEIRSVRLQKLELLKQAGKNPFASNTKRTHTIKEVVDMFDTFASTQTVTLSGRVLSLRVQGALIFLNFSDGTATFQGLLKKGEPTAEDVFTLFFDTIDIGDFIELTGTLFVTNRGQQTVLVTDWDILTKSLAPLPEKWAGIVDPDERYRKRYLDILMDEELKNLFYKKALFWESTRNFMKEKGFLEVETPTLEVTTGGAEANPFKTHHKDFDIDVFMRISVGELWQKRLMAAGFPKTFEIGRVYRNEGTSPDHLQEFTNMEFYWGYADYEMGMKLVEELYKHVALQTFGKTTFTTRGHTFDLNDEWKRISYVDEIKNQTSIDVLEATEREMKYKLDELGVQYTGDNKERLTDTLWKYCRKHISGPAFLVRIPKLVSPLAKACIDDPRVTERFQPIIAGSEVGNGFSELNDPIDQRARFDLQQELIDRGDDEAMMPEWEFVEMLEHGMPPTCGFGFGERFFAFLADKPLRETQLFPLMRPKDHIDKNTKKETMVTVVVLNKKANLEKWQELNTIAHLNAAFGAHVGRELFTKDMITSRDNQQIKLNIKNAIIVKTIDSVEKLRDLSIEAKKQKLEVTEFTREMLETTNDNKIIEITASKNFDEIEYLGILVYGAKANIEKLTADLILY